MKHRSVTTPHRRSTSPARRRAVRAGLAGVGLAVIVGAGGGAYGAYSAATTNVRGTEDSTETAKDVIFKGGPVRVGTQIYAHGNDTHAVIGIDAVTVENCNLVLSLDHKPGQRVMAAVVEEDETISKLGIQAGLSGGGARGVISFYKAGKKVCANSPVFKNSSNVWVSIVTVDAPLDPAAR